MTKPLNFSVWALLLAVALPPLHSQGSATVPPGSNAVASPSQVAQAPDEMTKKITALFHAGRYAEAQKLTEGLLIAYPDDQRLIRAKALIDKLLAPASPTGAAPVSNQSAQPASNANAAQLSGMDKVDYNALIVLARQALQSTDLDEQKRVQQHFMDQSHLFLKRHPEQMLLWQLRAQIAVSEDEVLAGYEAGQKLLAAGAADSNDAALQNLMGQLKNKGWFESEAALVAKKQEEITNKYGWMLGNWTESSSQIVYVYVPFTGACWNIRGNCTGKSVPHTEDRVYKEEFDLSNSLPVIEAYIPDDSGKTKWIPTKLSLDGSGELRCELYIDQEHAYKQATSCQIDENRKTMSISVMREGKSEEHSFTKTDVAQQGTASSLSPSSTILANADHAAAGHVPTFNPVPQSAAPAQQHSTAFDNSNQQPVPQRAETTRAADPPTPSPAVQADSSTIVLASARPETSTGTTTAILHLYRLSHLTGQFVQYDIEIDGRKVAQIANARSVRLDLPFGKHNINATYRTVKSDHPLYDLEMESGKEYWIRVDLSEGLVTHMRLAVVSETEAREESGKLKETVKSDRPEK